MKHTKIINRVKIMLKLDFYRLFHTPIFYIMIGVSAIIPALLLTMSGMENPTTGQLEGTVIENVWQIVSTSSTISKVNGMGGFATIDMVFIFAGLLMAIFVSHDYSSGFVKNIFTVHSKKQDYAISKTFIGVFSGICMMLAYILGVIVSGLITSKSFDVHVWSLILCLLSKMSMMMIFCSLFLAIAIFFKEKLWLTIIATFLFGMLLYPAASIASLDATLITLVISFTGSILLGTGFLFVSNIFLKKRDLI